jgi:hypothetical protein
MLRYKIPEWIGIKKPYLLDLRVNLYQFNEIETPGFIDYLEKNPEYIDWPTLSSNPAAINLLLKNKYSIRWSSFSANPAAIDILLENKDRIDWKEFSKNPHPKAFKYLMESARDLIDWPSFSTNINPDVCIFLQKNQSYIDWSMIASNPNAYEILKENYPYFANHYYRIFINMCSNPNPDIIALLDIHRIRWCVLSRNPAGIDVLLKYPELIDWTTFSENTHPLALKHMRANKEKIYWEGLLGNPAAMDLIKEMSNTYPITEYIWFNPSLFVIDYVKMAEERMSILREELMMKTLHPSRIQKLIELGCDIDDL